MTKEMYEDLLERNRLQISELNTLTEEQDKHITDLEKENAELKEDNSEWEKASDKWKSVYELTNNQLTNAKEIICEYVRLANLEKEDTIAIWQLYHKAEQFLKDSEVEK